MAVGSTDSLTRIAPPGEEVLTPEQQRAWAEAKEPPATPGTTPAALARLAPLVAVSGPATAPAAPPASQQPFTVDQVRAWAEGKQPPVGPAAPAAPAEEQPFTADQVKQWAERGTQPWETSPALKDPDWWQQLLLTAVPLAGPALSDLEQTNLGRLLIGHALHSEAKMAAGVPRMGAAAIGAFTEPAMRRDDGCNALANILTADVDRLPQKQVIPVDGINFLCHCP